MRNSNLTRQARVNEHYPKLAYNLHDRVRSFLLPLSVGGHMDLTFPPPLFAPPLPSKPTSTAHKHYLPRSAIDLLANIILPDDLAAVRQQSSCFMLDSISLTFRA